MQGHGAVLKKILEIEITGGSGVAAASSATLGRYAADFRLGHGGLLDWPFPLTLLRGIPGDSDNKNVRSRFAAAMCIETWLALPLRDALHRSGKVAVFVGKLLIKRFQFLLGGRLRQLVEFSGFAAIFGGRTH
jgi:hypothetical protein